MPRFSILLFIIISFSCVKVHKGPVDYEELVLLQSYDLDIEGPSGLSRSYIPDHFFTVCDKSGSIYLINKTGETLLTFNIGGDDLEGVEYVEDPASIYVLEERLRIVIKLTPGGNIVDTFELNIPIQNLNDGPEGIAFNPVEKHFYIVNEKNPSHLFIYDTLFGPIADQPLSWAKDFSSLDYDATNNKLWILSQQSQLLAICDLYGKPRKIYETGIPDGEGLVVDIVNQLIYIVGDDNSRLYVFKLPEWE